MLDCARDDRRRHRAPLARCVVLDDAGRQTGDGGGRGCSLCRSERAASRHYCWFDSPCAGAWAIALLLEPRDRNWNTLVGSVRSRRGDERDRLEQAHAHLLAQTSLADIAGIIASFGHPLAPPLMSGGLPPKSLHSDFLGARLEVHGDVSALFAQPMDTPLQRAEDRLWGNAGVLRSGLFCHTPQTLVSQNFYSGYSFTQMAMDDNALGTRTPPPLLQAAWTIARSVGPWWAWMGAAMLSEHPVELHVDAEGRPHRADGPAAVYRDGWNVFAWEGYAMREQWILYSGQRSERRFEELSGLIPQTCSGVRIEGAQAAVGPCHEERALRHGAATRPRGADRSPAKTCGRTAVQVRSLQRWRAPCGVEGTE